MRPQTAAGKGAYALMATEAVPVIDLANFPAEKEKLAAAAAGLGCFRVANHGVPSLLMSEMKAAIGSLFELPAEVKLRNSYTAPILGYVPPFRLTPFYEAFGIYDAASLADVDAFCSLLEISALQREIFRSYASKLYGLINKLASKVAESLGLVGYSFEEWPCLLRMNRYNFTEGTTLGSSGATVHSDPNFITVLLEDEFNDGLEIMGSTGNFMAVDPVPGTFFVNIGDIGKVWSNGRLHNVQHRVICKKAAPRISVAFLMLAPKDNKIEPQPGLIDSEHPLLYQAFDYMEYKEIRNSTSSIAGDVLLRWTADQQ